LLRNVKPGSKDGKKIKKYGGGAFMVNKKWLVLSLTVCLVFTMLAGYGYAAPKSIDFVSMWNVSEPQGIYMKQMATDFEKATKIKVNLTLAGRDILTKIRSRLIMGNPPDLIDQDLTELKASLLSGSEILATPLNDFLYKTKGPEGQAKMMDLFNEPLVKLFEKDGKLYFFPYEFITSGFNYDKSLFKANGVAAPKTWSDFIKVNETLKAKGIAPLADDGNISFYNAYYWYWICQRVNGSGAFHRAAADTTGAAWDEPGFLKAAQLLHELSKGGKDLFQDGYDGSNYPAAQADWALGKSGSVLCGSWIPVETQKQTNPGFEFGAYAFPEVEGGKGKITDVEAYLIGFAVPKAAKNKAEAMKFMSFIVKKANGQKFANDTINMSSRKDVDYPALLADFKPIVGNAKTFHRAYDGVWADYPEWWTTVFYPADNNLFFGKTTPEQFIKDIKQASIDYWAKKK
jgi:ABC-type glycerol-3-phosphate transport system substrate-binding protein